jgi:two-component system sensor histidine kinase PhoQ|tara:strand:- start:141 stop:1562 length:1422 start_codon:yes stop_codon:yes gene_type:complete
MGHSLRGRLLLTATAVLFVFLGLTGVVLDQAFRRSAERGEEEKLLLHIYGLLAVAEESKNGIFLPGQLQEPRFNQLGTGLFGFVTDSSGTELWRSPSALDIDFDQQQSAAVNNNLATGEERFGRVHDSEQNELFFLSYRILWQGSDGQSTAYVFTALETLRPYTSEIQGFRNNLWGWLGGVVIALLIVQGMVMRWGLAPLTQLADDLKAIEDGHSDYLEGPYPAEIEGVTRNLNVLISSEREQLEQYRTTLADLAHSLKTPLAILKGVASSLEQPNPTKNPNMAEIKQTVDEQISRMDEIVSYQLQRAVSSSTNLLRKSVDVTPLVSKLIEAMKKVYADKEIQFEISMNECSFFGDERDLMEMLGNLVENACKYGRSKVRVSAGTKGDLVEISTDPPESKKKGELVITIEDDGDGIPSRDREQVLMRGTRADIRESGQGIGLAVVADIVQRYQGHIEITDSLLGGAQVNLWLN